MADVANVRVMTNGYRNVVLRLTLVSDGTGIAAPGQTIFDATSAGAFGVSKAGQTFYPGIHTKIRALDYDVQDMKARLQWDATTPEDVLALGNAPEDFDWTRMGGLTCPPGLVGATGSLKLITLNSAPMATLTMILYLTKNVPQA